MGSHARASFSTRDVGGLIKLRCDGVLLQWFEDELSRAYVLCKARQVSDLSQALRHTPRPTHTKATHTTPDTQEQAAGQELHSPCALGGGRAGQSRGEGWRWGQHRWTQDTPLPSLHLHHPSSGQSEGRRGRGEEEEEEVGAVLQYVVGGMKHDLFTTLLGMMSYS